MDIGNFRKVRFFGARFSGLFAPLLLLSTGSGALGMALASQYWGGLQPCILCLYQRWPHALAIGLGALALLVPRRLSSWISFLGGFILLIGAGIALFHLGVEERWWPGTESCSVPQVGANSLEALRQALLAAPVVRCDVPVWSLFGVSMAGYNMMCSLSVGFAVLVSAALSIKSKS